MEYQTEDLQTMIIIDLSFIRFNLYAGVSKYAYRLLDYIVEEGKSDDYILLLNIVSENKIREWYPQFKTISIGSQALLKYPMIRTIYLSYDFRRKVNQSGCQAVFCPWGNEITCLKVKPFKISVIHDLQLRLDTKGLLLKIHQIIDDTVVKNSDKIVTISEFSRSQILSFYPNVESKVISLGNSVLMYPDERERLFKDRYILYVGRICEMKNVMTLIKAYSLIHSQMSDCKLVVVGGRNNYWDNVIEPILKENNIQEKVNLVQNCSEADLTNYYRYADLFVFPSLREGFGSPPLEAAILKTPVLTSIKDSLGEVTRGLLYQLDDPCDEHEMASKMSEILTNPPSEENLEKIKDELLLHYSIQNVGKRICDYIKEVSWKK
ncbi:MAG: glycosyltransferase family 1 protein [Phocaeicola massiliensis]|jgi:glycosyltransferase involved in cell wall biosynthesis|nr:glycosyltransferase family 1 protein [Phocaeicola massiliensis]